LGATECDRCWLSFLQHHAHDGVKHFNKEGEVVVKDVAELIAEAGDL
jgi:hypothetical protein